jgi:hypothetical protein
MGDNDTPGLIDTVKSIGDEASRLVSVLTTKAAENADLTSRELKAIDKLVKQSEAALSEASQLAKKQRQVQIAELEKMVKQLESAIATPGLPRTARADLQALKRRKRAQLVGLLARESMDFGGILTATQVEHIRDVLKRAKKDIARKKKAAAFLATVMEVADISLSIVGKVVA